MQGPCDLKSHVPRHHPCRWPTTLFFIIFFIFCFIIISDTPISKLSSGVAKGVGSGACLPRLGLALELGLLGDAAPPQA